MSRLYKMEFIVTGYIKENEDDILEAISSIWEVDCDDFYKSYATEESIKAINAKTGLDLPHTYLSIDGENFLYGGESEQDFSERAILKIWKANGSFCHISICATYLEEIPYEQYDFKYDKYLEMIKDKKDDNNDNDK